MDITNIHFTFIVIVKCEFVIFVCVTMFCVCGDMSEIKCSCIRLHVTGFIYTLYRKTIFYCWGSVVSTNIGSNYFIFEYTPHGGM